MNYEAVKIMLFFAWLANLLMGAMIGAPKGQIGISMMLAAIFGPIGLLGALGLAPSQEALEDQALRWLQAKEAAKKRVKPESPQG